MQITGTSSDNQFSFAGLSLQENKKPSTDEAIDDDTNSSFFKKYLHKFVKDEASVNSTSSFLKSSAGGSLLAGLISPLIGPVISKDENFSRFLTISGIGLSAISYGLSLAVQSIAKKVKNAMTIRSDVSSQKDINLDTDLILDEDTKKDLWIAMKSFFGYKSGLQDPNHSVKASDMMILFGPPGTGKTKIAYGIASQANRKIIYANISEVESMWRGESEKKLANLFELAEKSGSWIFFDEADALLQTRKTGPMDNGITNRITNTFIQHFNNKHPNVKVILCTNSPDNIDPAIKSRGLLVHIDKQSDEANFKILKIKLESFGLKKDNIDKLFEKFSSRLMDLVKKYKLAGRDIESAVNSALHIAEQRFQLDTLNGKEAVAELTIEDLESEFKRTYDMIEKTKKSSLDIGEGLSKILKK